MDLDRPGRIIVGIDTTPSGLRALRVAAAEAQVRGTPLHAVRTWTPTAPDPAPPEPGRLDPGALEPLRPGVAAPGTGRRDLATEGRIATDVVTIAFAETFGGEPAGVEVHTVLVPDDPGRVLVEYACRDHDLLVLGAGRPGRLRRRWRSGIVRYCVAHATCPVLVVPPPPLARAGSPRAMLRQLRRELDQLADADANAEGGPDR